MDAPEGDPGQICVHLFARILSFYRRLSAQFQFSLSAVTLVYLTYRHSPFTLGHMTAKIGNSGCPPAAIFVRRGGGVGGGGIMITNFFS